MTNESVSNPEWSPRYTPGTLFHLVSETPASEKFMLILKFLELRVNFDGSQSHEVYQILNVSDLDIREFVVYPELFEQKWEIIAP